MQREGEAPIASRALRVIVKRPMITSTVFFQGRGSEFAGNEGGNECAAGLIAVSNQPHGEPAAISVKAHVHAQGANGTPAAARLVRIEEPEKCSARTSGKGGGERAGGGELVVQSFGWREHGGIGSLRAGALYDSAHFAEVLACELRFAVAEVLLHHPRVCRHISVVVTLPAWIVIKVFYLKSGCGLVSSQQDLKAARDC